MNLIFELFVITRGFRAFIREDLLQKRDSCPHLIRCDNRKGGWPLTGYKSYLQTDRVRRLGERFSVFSMPVCLVE